MRVLGEVDVLACEDTRVTRKLFSGHNISSPKTIFSHHEHNEAESAKGIVALIEQGKTVALCVDGGMPCISDPGYRLVSLAREKGIDIEVLPGPSAVVTALAASGIPTSSFTFKGFPPRKSGARKRFLDAERDQPHTLILYESPHRIEALLADALETLGDRLAALCIEMTKKFEKVQRGYLSELAPEGRRIRGEITVVIAGNKPKFLKPPSDSG